MNEPNDATLWKLVDGELPPDEAEAIRAAAAEDPALRRRIEVLEAAKAGILGDAPRPPPDFAARLAVRAATLAPAPVLDLEDARRFLRRALVAAALLAALGLTALAVEVVPDLFRAPPVSAEPNPFLPGPAK